MPLDLFRREPADLAYRTQWASGGRSGGKVRSGRTVVLESRLQSADHREASLARHSGGVEPSAADTVDTLKRPATKPRSRIGGKHHGAIAPALPGDVQRSSRVESRAANQGAKTRRDSHVDRVHPLPICWCVPHPLHSRSQYVAYFITEETTGHYDSCTKGCLQHPCTSNTGAVAGLPSVATRHEHRAYLGRIGACRFGSARLIRRESLLPIANGQQPRRRAGCWLSTIQDSAAIRITFSR